MLSLEAIVGSHFETPLGDCWLALADVVLGASHFRLRLAAAVRSSFGLLFGDDTRLLLAEDVRSHFGLLFAVDVCSFLGLTLGDDVLGDDAFSYFLPPFDNDDDSHFGLLF